MGFAEGVAWIRHSKGIAAYAAVSEVGLIATDLGKNLPELEPADRFKEGIYPGDYWDVLNVDDRLVASERTAKRVDIFDPNLSPLGSVDLPEEPRHLLFARACGSDDNEDGLIRRAARRAVPGPGGSTSSRSTTTAATSAWTSRPRATSVRAATGPA